MYYLKISCYLFLLRRPAVTSSFNRILIAGENNTMFSPLKDARRCHVARPERRFGLNGRDTFAAFGWLTYDNSVKLGWVSAQVLASSLDRVSKLRPVANSPRVALMRR